MSAILFQKTTAEVYNMSESFNGFYFFLFRRKKNHMQFRISSVRIIIVV